MGPCNLHRNPAPYHPTSSDQVKKHLGHSCCASPVVASAAGATATVTLTSRADLKFEIEARASRGEANMVTEHVNYWIFSAAPL